MLVVAYITWDYLYYIAGFAVEMSSYGVRVVGFIGNHLGGIHVGEV